MRYIWLIGLMALAGVLYAERPLFQGELDVTGVVINEEYVSYRISGTFSDRSAVGFTALDIAVNDLGFTENILGHVDGWRITNIVGASASVITADVVYAQSGTSTVGMVAGVMAICTLSTNEVGYPQRPSSTGARVSEHMLNEIRNYTFRRMDSYTKAQSDALLAGKAGTGAVAAIDGRVATLDGATNTYVLTNNATFLSVLKTMTNYTAVASSSNYLAYDPATRTLSGCVTNAGSGTGSATNWYAYEQLGLIYRVTVSTNTLWFGQEITTNLMQRDVRGYYTITTNIVAGKPTYESTNGYSIAWTDEDGGAPLPPTSCWYFADGVSAKSYYTTNTEPIGAWTGGVNMDPPTSSYYSVTNTYGLDSNGVFRVKTRDVMTELDGKVGATDAAYTNALALSANAVQTELDPRLPAHGTAGNLLRSTGAAWQSWTPNYLTSVAYGTTDTTAYRGDHGAAVSNTAAAALPKTFTNAAAVTTLKITGGTPAVGDMFIVTNASGAGTLTSVRNKLVTVNSQTTNTANMVITGVGFKPTSAVIFATAHDLSSSSGLVDRTGVEACTRSLGATLIRTTGASAYLHTDSAKAHKLAFASWDANGATFTRTSTDGIANVATSFIFIFYR